MKRRPTTPVKHPNTASPKRNASPSIGIETTFQIPFNKLEFGKELGQGGFGVVYQGEYGGQPVAIKKLHHQHLSQETLKEFQDESQIMAKLHFPRIIRFYGACFEPGKYAMVMELMPKGSLYDALHNGQPIPWKIKTQIALDIGHGLQHLHEQGIIHRDLKSLNVLLDDRMRAVLSDFGLSKIKSETSSSTKVGTAGSLAWMAPELFKRGAKNTEKTDIYSYSMTLWELVSHKIPFIDAGGNQALVSKWVGEGEREAIPEATPHKIAHLIQWCWDAEPDKRPSAGEAAAYLKEGRKSFDRDSNRSTGSRSIPRFKEGIDSVPKFAESNVGFKPV